MRDRQYLTNLAINIAGKRRLDHFRCMRRERFISVDVVRQIFMLDVLEAFIDMKISAETLGRICHFGKDLGASEYRDAFVVTTGTNAWSAMFLSSSDSGKTLLEKIAVATILKEINDLINVGQQEPADQSTNWMPLELVEPHILDQHEERAKRVMATLKWES